MSFLKIVAILIGVAILVIIISDSDFDRLVDYLVAADYFLVALSVLCYLVSLNLRMAKWWIFSNVVMGKTNRLNIFLPMYCIVHLLGNLTPIRSGEMSGPLFLRKYIQLPYSDGIALIVLETAIEAFVFGVGFLFAIIYFGVNFSSYSELSEAVIKWVWSYCQIWCLA